MTFIAISCLITVTLAVIGRLINTDKILNSDKDYLLQVIERIKAKIEEIENQEEEKPIDVLAVLISSGIVIFLSFLLPFWTLIKVINLIVFLFFQKFAELFIIIAVLVNPIGDSTYGYIALAVWISTWLINPTTAKLAEKYSPVKWMRRAYTFIPSAYLLYIFLVLIHVINYAR